MIKSIHPGYARYCCGKTQGRKDITMNIYICGDSTCHTGGARPPYYGWGHALNGFLPDICVFNTAEGGRSSKSFLEGGCLQKVLGKLAPGDLMLIQFGGNDSLADMEAVYTDPVTAYPQYLMQYVNGARDRGAQPVLLTSVWLRRYRGETAVDILHEYNDAVRLLAARENVPLIDVVGEALPKMQRMTKEETAAYFCSFPAGIYKDFPDGRNDNNHSSFKGAGFNAQIIAEGLKKLGLVQTVPAD